MVDSDASSHSLGTWSLSKRRRGMARAPTALGTKSWAPSSVLPKEKGEGLNPNSFSSRAEPVGAYPYLVTSFAGNKVQSQHQPQQGKSHPGSCWSHRESQISEGIGSEGPRESPDSTALESAVEPGIWSGLRNVELVFVCLLISQRRGFLSPHSL